MLGGGFRLTVKQEGSGTLPSLKLKDVQHLKERSPTVEYPASTTLDDRHALYFIFLSFSILRAECLSVVN